MTLLVDGYNLYFSGIRPGDDEPRDIEEARAELVELVARYARSVPCRAVVFFDGGPGGSHLPRIRREGSVEVRFSRPGKDADTDIKRAVEAWRREDRLRVITSDGAVSRFVRSLGVKVTRSQDFAAEIEALRRREEKARPSGRPPRDEPPEKYGGSPNQAEVNYWLRIFTRDRRRR